MNKNIWRDFAKLNDMSESEFFSEITITAMAVMSMELDKSDSGAIKITQGKYTLMLIDDDKKI
tara:strand:- start:14253 stop:14441 length:189 start_codon:yes stop_codon:yes gene_type:complete